MPEELRSTRTVLGYAFQFLKPRHENTGLPSRQWQSGCPRTPPPESERGILENRYSRTNRKDSWGNGKPFVPPFSFSRALSQNSQNLLRDGGLVVKIVLKKMNGCATVTPQVREFDSRGREDSRGVRGQFMHRSSISDQDLRTG